MKMKTIGRIAFKKLRFAWNYLFDQGKLPNFIVAGVQKGGTTFLHANLTKHRQIQMNPNFYHKNASEGLDYKEPQFFTYKYRKKGVRWYKSLFNKNRCLQGEVTPNYLSHERAIRRIHRTAPDVKLIVILRDPVTRAYSQFNHFQALPSLRKYLLKPGGNFMENLEEEIEAGFPSEKIISQGFYHDCLCEILRYFNREKLLILISERARKDPDAALNDICEFLEIEPFQAKLSPSVHERSYAEPMSASAREKLCEIYKPHNEKLFALLGYEINEWMS